MLQMSARAITTPDAQHENTPAALIAQLLLRRTGNWSRWLRRHWSDLTICDAVCSMQWIAGRPRLHAEVCLTLGHILPADIRVDLIAAEPLPDAHPLARGRAMFSVAVRHNGSYWFAVNAPADAEDGARDWIVHIRPSRPVTGTPEIQPLVSALEVVPAGIPRHCARQPHSA